MQLSQSSRHALILIAECWYLPDQSTTPRNGLLDYFGRHFGWYCGHGSHVLQKKASGGKSIMYTWLGNIYVPLTISIGTDITKTWAVYCNKHRDVPGELSDSHRDVATQTGDDSPHILSSLITVEYDTIWLQIQYDTVVIFNHNNNILKLPPKCAVLVPFQPVCAIFGHVGTTFHTSTLHNYKLNSLQYGKPISLKYLIATHMPVQIVR